MARAPFKPAKINTNPGKGMAAVREVKPKKTNPFSRSLVQTGANAKYKNV
jgi:hypothetical protein